VDSFVDSLVDKFRSVDNPVDILWITYCSLLFLYRSSLWFFDHAIIVIKEKRLSELVDFSVTFLLYVIIFVAVIESAKQTGKVNFNNL